MVRRRQHHLVVDIGEEQYIYEVVVEESGKYKVTLRPTPKCLCGNIEIAFQDRQIQWEQIDEGGILLEGRAELALNDCPYHLEDKVTLSYRIDKENPNTAEGNIVGEEGDRLKVTKAGEVTVIALGIQGKGERLAEKKAVFIIIPKELNKEEPKEGNIPEKEEPKEGGMPEEEEPKEGSTPEKEEPKEGGTPEKEEPEEGNTPEREMGLEGQKYKRGVATQGIKTTQQGSVVFKDIETHWAKEAIYFLIERGFFVETTEEQFYPDLPLNRRTGIEIVEKLGARHWPAEIELSKEGSRKEGSLRQTGSLIEDFITREQMVTLLYEQACNQNKLLTIKNIPSTFYDYEEVDEQAREAVRAFEQAGLIVGR